MSLHRRNPKRDAAEPAIVAALKAVGATIVRLSIKDAPDLMVGFRGGTVLLEVKSGKRRPRDKAQEDWRVCWKGGPVFRVETVSEALAAIGLSTS